MGEKSPEVQNIIQNFEQLLQIVNQNRFKFTLKCVGEDISMIATI